VVSLARIWRPLLAMCSPAVLVIVALAAAEGFSTAHAIVAVLAAAGGIGLLVHALLSDVAALRKFIGNLGDDPDAPRPPLVFSGTLAPLVTGMRETVAVSVARAAPRPATNTRSTPGLDRLPDPVLMLNEDRRITRANLAAHELLGDSLLGRDLSTVLRNPNVLLAVDGVLAGDESTAEVEFDFTIPVERNFSARISALEEEGDVDIAVVIALYDITELKRTEALRSDFIANVSHELRTPLSVLLGSLQTLRGAARDDPEAQEQFFGLMENQAERMSRLVDDLLSLSRIEMNEHAVPTQAVDISDMLEEVVSTLSIKAREQAIKIRTEIAEGFPELPGDKNDLSMVFQNLLDNAIKYGNPDSEIDIAARLADIAKLPSALSGNLPYVAISVRDRGPGIDADHIPRLTERFYRVDSQASRQRGGTGLGLAIVKHAVNRHRGALAIESEPNSGSTFTVYLPVRRSGPEPRSDD